MKELKSISIVIVCGEGKSAYHSQVLKIKPEEMTAVFTPQYIDYINRSVHDELERLNNPLI